MVSIAIEDGWFHQVLGQCAENGGFVFIALLGDLSSEQEIISYRRVRENPMFPLSDYIEGQTPSILHRCEDLFGEAVNSPWVRARIPAIFGCNILISLSVPDYKYGLVEQTFVASELESNGDWIAYPFICEDYNLRTGLRFNPDDSLNEIYKRIAKAFWELLLLESESVCAFRDGYLHYNEMDDEEWHNVVYKNGKFRIEITDAAFI
ncbi:MAG: hypothetical protein FWK04_00350 [Nostoc sp. GBBB01]|uniref:Uncharacterized protein n=1 Tax=Nostoc punctiforme FACHB-252 TaxID=1357509 RepID=A0ABR8HGB0_NOSPU|nr:hypothetical protein [Nostoc punctiforme]MBD2614215.1 hypothetical protein [Nostoc punctiforme FACHB-252]MBL1197556.1 hypothetical protein [Nostoc sp. GBBB01]